MNMRRTVALGIATAIMAGGCGLARRPKVGSLPPAQMSIVAVPELAGTDELLFVGETFEYKVRWLGMDVGKAVLAVKRRARLEERLVYHIQMNVMTHGFFSLFFHVSGVVDSYVDAQTRRPVYYNSETVINRKFVFKQMWYDFEKRKVKAKDRKGTYELDLEPQTLDPLGIFYFFRTRQVVIDEPFEVVINGGKRNFPVTIYARPKRKLHVPAGTYDAFLIEPTAQSERQFDDILNAAGSLRIWFSADFPHIPLMITLQVPLGTAVAVLNEVTHPQPGIDAATPAVVQCPSLKELLYHSGGHSL